MSGSLCFAMRPDGRWMVYYRRDGKLKWEVFGRGTEAEAAAWRRQEELGLARTRPPREDYGPASVEIAEAYQANKSFSPNSRKHLLIRLKANILPFFGLMPAVRINDNDVDRYKARNRRVAPAHLAERKLEREDHYGRVGSEGRAGGTGRSDP